MHSGFTPYLPFNELLFPFQRFIVDRAIRAGKYAIFADCGLGKTFMSLDWGRHVTNETKQPVLILAPLAVVEQTIQEGQHFGYSVSEWDVNLNYDLKEDRESVSASIYIINYDQIENVDTRFFSGVVLDESSILKNFEGATKRFLIQAFKDTPYKLCCTATPSPNDPMELGNHSEFLDVMTRLEMLAMYFVHDGGETSKWRLKGHAEKMFYQWVGTWAIMLSKPEDIGFHMDGYNLPTLHYIEKQIVTEKRGNGMLFNDVAVSATNFNQELRLTLLSRLDEVVEIVNNSTENFIIWVKQNE